MAWRRKGGTSVAYCQLDPWNKIQWNSNQNTKFIIRENVFENVVCEMAATLSWGGGGGGGMS